MNWLIVLEKPDLQDEKIIACLGDAYGLNVDQIAFLPLGADRNTAVYRVLTKDAASYFVKLRRGVFDETCVALPKFLSDQGIGHLIVPLAATTGQLWAGMEPFSVIVYPFIEGHDGYAVDLADEHWRELGRALRRIHAAVVPPALRGLIRRETYSSRWRERTKAFLERIERDAFDDLVAVKAAAFLKGKRREVLDLVECAERFARSLAARSPELVLCHSDLHAGNILIDTSGAFYIVDWDDPIMAPKERDLMYAGGGQFGGKRTPAEEEALFYEGYGQTQADPVGLAYYRYERIVEDVAIYCEQIFLTEEGGQDREQSLEYLTSNWMANHTIEIAYKAAASL